MIAEVQPADRIRALLRPVAIALVLGLGGALLAVGAPLIAIGVTVAILLVVATVWLPGVLFGLYLVLPYYKAAAQDFSPIDLTVALALLMSIQIVPVILGYRPRGSARPVITLWVVLALMVLIGVVYAQDQDLAIDRALNWAFLVFIPVMAGALRVGADATSVRHLLWTFLGLGMVVTFLGISQLSGEQRLEVLGTDTIAVARAALLVPIMALFFILPRGGTLTRYVTIVSIPAALIVAVASGSRGPLLAFLIVFAVWALQRRPGFRSGTHGGGRAIAGVAIASVVILWATAASLPDEALRRFERLGEFAQSVLAGEDAAAQDSSAGARVTLFRGAWAMFEDNPVAGSGTAGFEAGSQYYVGVREAAEYPHNALLQFAAEYGIVGVVIFAIFVAAALVRRLPAGPPMAIRALYLYFLLNAMVSGNIFEDRTLWGLLLLILVLAPGRVKDDGARSRSPSEPLAGGVGPVNDRIRRESAARGI